MPQVVNRAETRRETESKPKASSSTGRGLSAGLAALTGNRRAMIGVIALALVLAALFCWQIGLFGGGSETPQAGTNGALAAPKAGSFGATRPDGASPPDDAHRKPKKNDIGGEEP